jgi:hypothetical protein
MVELLAHPDGLRGRHTQRPGGVLLVELEQPRAAGGRAERAGGSRDVPAAVVVLGIQRIAHAACNVDAEHQRVDHLAAARAAHLGEREHGGSDRSCRMDDRLQVRVVEVERVRGDAVHERSARHVDLVVAPQDARLSGGLEHPDRAERGFGRLVPGGADRAADPVEEGAVGFVLHRVAPAARRMRRDEFRQDLRDGRRVVIRFDFGIFCHGISP